MASQCFWRGLGLCVCTRACGGGLKSCVSLSASIQSDLATDERFIIYDLGVHALDVARFFLGDACEVYCRKQRVNPAIAGEDCATMVVGMASGATCVVDVSYASTLEEELFPQTLIELEGPRGSCRIDKHFEVTLVQHNTDGPPTITKTAVRLPVAEWMSGPGHLIQASVPPTLQHFIDCLRSKSEPETSGLDNLKTFALMMAAYDSADGGVVVKVV
jgi:predicted dehydrogenase